MNKYDYAGEEQRKYYSTKSHIYYFLVEIMIFFFWEK